MEMTGLVQDRLRLFWRHLLFMCQKELLTTLKDRRMRAMMVVPALMQGFLFGYAASYNLDNVPYAVVDEARSASSRSLLGHFAGSGSFQLVAMPDSPREIGQLIDREEILLAVVIPGDFERKLQQGQAAEVQVIADGRGDRRQGGAGQRVGGKPHLVQPQPDNPLDFFARLDCHDRLCAGAAAGGDVHSAGEGAGNL